jgi:putative DNA primase/helicase
LKYQPNDSLYIYSDAGYWKQLVADYVEAEALEMVGDNVRSAQLTDIRRLTEKLSVMEPGKQFDEFNGHCNIRSGMLDLNTFNIKPHHKDYLSRIQLPVNYDPSATCPSWEKFLSEILEEDSQLMALLQEFTGYCLVPDTSFQKALILCGEGSNGKSTALQVLDALLGRQNICSVALSDLGNEFHRVRLHGKLVNIATEIDPKTLERSDYFKSIVTGDTISASHKHKPAFDFRPVCKLIFACNRLPRVRDNTHAFYRRLIIIPFNRRFEGEDADLYLGQRLLEELDGVFLWALRGLDRLRQQGHFTESEQADNALADYRRFNNPLVAFIEDCCRLDSDASTSKDTLYDEYKSYIQESGYSALGKETFFRELYAMRPELKPTRIRRSGQREQVVMGIVVVKYI